jgi:hypothetical protein
LHTGLAIAPYGIGLFLDPLVSASPVRLRPRLLAMAMGIQVAGYAPVAALVGWGTAETPLLAAVFIAGHGQGVAFPRLYNTVLGDVPPHQAGLAAGIVNSASQVGASVSAAAIGSLFFTLLANDRGERDFGFAFAIAQAALFAAMLIAVPRRSKPAAMAIEASQS